MRELIDKLKEFNTMFNVPTTPLNELDYLSQCKLRFDLMKEENKEYYDAVLDNDKVEIADALTDQLYVLCGTILYHGLEDKIIPLFNEVHASNMSKLEDGKPIFRSDGKVMKGKDYFKPNINKILNE